MSDSPAEADTASGSVLTALCMASLTDMKLRTKIDGISLRTLTKVGLPELHESPVEPNLSAFFIFTKTIGY
jgi:hypothetical protein